MTVSGPYYTTKPRYAGEHWRVTVATNDGISTTRGFHTEAEAQAYADLAARQVS